MAEQLIKCIGYNCKLKDKCYRYTFEETEKNQKWLMRVPVKYDGFDSSCDYFISNENRKK